jgi:hypothetical protein
MFSRKARRTRSRRWRPMPPCRMGDTSSNLVQLGVVRLQAMELSGTNLQTLGGTFIFLDAKYESATVSTIPVLPSRRLTMDAICVVSRFSVVVSSNSTPNLCCLEIVLIGNLFNSGNDPACSTKVWMEVSWIVPLGIPAQRMVKGITMFDPPDPSKMTVALT